MLNLGVDSLNINLAFQNLLINELKEKVPHNFYWSGTFYLDSDNNRFSRLVKEIDNIVELDQMASDFHLFLKYSAGTGEDFAKVSEIIGVLSNHLEKHCTSQ